MTRPSSIRLGTRTSALARWQADWVADRLRESGVEVELVLITTEGDVKQGPLGEIGGQGLFTKQIQQALLDERIDLAVHSLKDLPTEQVGGLVLAAVPLRESAGDVLVCNAFSTIQELPPNSRIGTGSTRRKAQLLHARPDLQIEDIRGNVDTRLAKLDRGDFDAIILAEAGLKRLGLEDRIAQIIPSSLMLPAVGQGALGLETREDDEATRGIVAQLNDESTEAAVLAERALLRELRAGCLAPVGACARVEEDSLQLEAVVLSSDGQQRLSANGTSAAEDFERLGGQVAQDLMKQGAIALIASSHE